MMSIHVNLCLLLVVATVFNTVSTAPTTSTDAEEHHKKLGTVVLLDRFAFDTHNPSSNFDENEDQTFPTKRELKKKWAKFYSGSQSPYTIAFPALIRTRRWIEQEDQ